MTPPPEPPKPPNLTPGEPLWGPQGGSEPAPAPQPARGSRGSARPSGAASARPSGAASARVPAAPAPPAGRPPAGPGAPPPGQPASYGAPTTYGRGGVPAGDRRAASGAGHAGGGKPGFALLAVTAGVAFLLGVVVTYLASLFF